MNLYEVHFYNESNETTITQEIEAINEVAARILADNDKGFKIQKVIKLETIPEKSVHDSSHLWFSRHKF